jgi:hypothetical protein
MLYSRLLLDYHPFELTDSVMFLVNCLHFVKKKFKKKNLSYIPCFFKKITQLLKNNCQKLPTI